MLRFLRQIVREQRGIAAIELAVALPILMSMLLGTVEFGRYVLLNQKLQNAASSAADFATREDTISAAGLNDIFSATRQIISPFELALNGNLVVSAVGRDGGDPPTVLWQSNGTGELEVSSNLGAPGSTAVLPETFAMDNDETAIIVEIFYQYEPWLSGIIPGSTISKSAYFRPRFGGLASLDDS